MLKLSMESITLIETTKEGVNVIPIQEYVSDIKKRVGINNQEVSLLIKDLVQVYNKAKPGIDSMVQYLKNTYTNIKAKTKELT